jgi:hypothetical protein
MFFFQSLSNSLLKEGRISSEANTENYGNTLIAIATALREMLKRTLKTLLYDLPSLINSIKNVSECLGLDNDLVAFHALA